MGKTMTAGASSLFIPGRTSDIFTLHCSLSRSGDNTLHHVIDAFAGAAQKLLPLLPHCGLEIEERAKICHVSRRLLCGLLAFRDRHFLHGPPPPSAHTRAYKPITQADASRKEKNLSFRIDTADSGRFLFAV
jgi:hypothetical protein